MLDLNRILIVVCEGASEKAYIQELNRFFREEDIPLSIIPRPSDGGGYSKVIRKYREVRKANPRSKIYIWVDYDRYARNERGDMVRYTAKPKDIPDFLFSMMNFEDVLSMHLKKFRLNLWIAMCTGEKHFSKPMYAATYEKLFRSFLGENYQKGEIPIPIDSEHLSNLFENLQDPSVPFHSGFHLMLQEHLKW